MPPELRWQSGRLLTDRSLVRSQVVATRFIFFFIFYTAGRRRAGVTRNSLTPRAHGATAARRIPDPKVGGSNPSGLMPFPFFTFFVSNGYVYATHADSLPPELRWQSGRLLTDRSLVRSQVVAYYFFVFSLHFLFFKICASGASAGSTPLRTAVGAPGPADVPVAQLDKASDYESEDWGFKSLQGYFFIFPKLQK